jgi:hypothetical protein
MQVMLYIEAIRFGGGEKLWWKSSQHFHQVFRCIRESGLWLGFQFYKKAGAKRFRRFDTDEQLLGATTSWKRGSYVLTIVNTEEPDCDITFVLDPTVLTIRFFMAEHSLDQNRPTLINRFIDLTSRLCDTFCYTALMGPRLGVRISDLPYRRVRPPRLHRIWSAGNAVDFISKRYHEQSPSSELENVKKLVNTPVPNGVVRTEKGDLIIIRWVDDLIDEHEIAAKLSIREQWFTKVLNPPIDPSYNKFGDVHETPLSTEEKPPLTFYDPMYETGYKAMVISPDGRPDKEILDEMAEWIKNRKLPDGTALQQLHVILPNRESALLIRDQVSSIGVDKVLYTDDEGDLWNPFPPGLWIE